MAFKLKSGNSPKFKMVGSSPVKATDSGLDTPEADAILQRSQDRKDKLELQRDMIDYAPWNVQKPGEVESGKEDDPTTPEDESKMKMEEGWDYSTEGGEDANINKYKSKSQIKYENKMSKLKSKRDDATTPEDESKYTKEEKYEDKLTNLENRQRRAKGTGGYGLKFDWRNMLAGDSIAAGFSIEKKEDLLGGKIKKHKDKYRRKQEKESIKKTYKTEKAASKGYKKYTKGIGKEISVIGGKVQPALSFEDWKKLPSTDPRKGAKGIKEKNLGKLSKADKKSLKMTKDDNWSDLIKVK